MSSYVEREWFWYLKGRKIHLYKLLGGYDSERITQQGVLRTQDKELKYPDEDIADGLRIEYTSLDEPFIVESLEDTTAYNSGTTISFSGSVITDSGSGFGDFSDNDKIKVQGSGSNDGTYTVTTAAAGSLTCSATTFVTESAGERIYVEQVSVEDTSVDEDSHVNLNRLLSLAVVDYVKAMLNEQRGDIEAKEYYMKEFFNKVGDNESNKRKVSMSFASSPYAVR